MLLSGLRAESRTKMKMANLKLTLDQILLATIADEIKLLMRRKKKDSFVSILDLLLNGEKEKECKGFNTPLEYENYWHKVTGVHHE